MAALGRKAVDANRCAPRLASVRFGAPSLGVEGVDEDAQGMTPCEAADAISRGARSKAAWHPFTEDRPVLVLTVRDERSVRVTGPCVIKNLGRGRWGFDGPPETLVIRTEIDDQKTDLYTDDEGGATL